VKDLKGSSCGLLRDTIPIFAWKNRGNLWKISGRIANLWPENTNQDCPNKKEC
jgi:hypothetical protein